MNVAWGVIVTLLSLLCWAGQAISWVAPSRAVNLSLMEAEDAVEPTFFADVRGEAAWDSLTLWTMVVAGVLLVVDQPAWAYFGLVGGGMYVYFAGRGIFTRLTMQRRHLRVGTAQNVRVVLTFLALWGVMGAITIVGAVNELSGS
jgi:hypothetical protein